MDVRVSEACVWGIPSRIHAIEVVSWSVEVLTGDIEDCA